MKKIVIMVNVASSLLYFRKELIQKLVELQYEVFCIAEGYTEETKDIILEWGAQPIEHHLKRNGLNPLSDIMQIIKIRKLLKEIKPDIILTCFTKPVIFGSIAAKLAGVKKRIGLIEGLGYSFTPSKTTQGLRFKLIKFVQIQLYRIALPTLNKVLFLNPDDKRDLLTEHNIYVNDSDILGGVGVNLNEFFYVPPLIEDNVSFLFVGRLLRDKGIFEFLEAAEKVKLKYPKAYFSVIGGIDDKNPTAISESLLKNYIDKGIINYFGHVQDVPTYISKANVFVLPSYREGIPKSTQEALAMGKPVITTDVPGCRETVISGINGFLVPIFSSDALSDKMIYFIKNKNEIIRMGKESRKLAETRFDVIKINQKLISILEI